MPDLSQINFPNDNNNPYDIKDASVPHSSLPAASGGSDLSLVTTGEKYNWNNYTDTKVTQTEGATGSHHEILFSETADDVTRTEGAKKSQDLTFLKSKSFDWTYWDYTSKHFVGLNSYGQLYLGSGGKNSACILGNGNIYANGNIDAKSLNGKDIGWNPKFTDTTYDNLPAASGGTDLSLVTTGEKYTWNNAGGNNTWEGTQAQYDALPSHDPNTVYYITDGSSIDANLDDLADVNILNPTDGDILKYSSGGWVNSAANVTQDISDQYTITKTSGNWSINSIEAYRSGNVIQINIIMSGNGNSVSAGSNGFVGTITAGALPVITVRLIGYYNNCPIILNVEPDGAINARVTAENVTVTSSGTLPLTGTYITNN